ncbi:D-lyxose/D-mannose family sugar isomerase [Paenibacillus dakarensis]|uniref:D-lyxose/D-mannose family sugar isomerase n=1 Tax=Paenibacillus dakarensis TaxID=1527293 RepID=UPI0006D5AFAE|nr:D-lyxose/D-mannose family sugar isomerase [Paenibacillus dakarensis]
MKRSEVNHKIKEAVDFIEQMNFKLPPFAYWGPEEWKTKGSEYDEIRDNMLGWDITDFGSGDFENIGLLLFTIRNGNLNNDKYIKTYAEKILIVEEEQVTPLHFHWNKMEDIINRGGGNLMVQVYNSTEDEELADTPVEISMDGRVCTVDAGTVLRITPGESITLPVGQYHKFWGEKGTGKVLIGEVSMVNDDNADNRFYEQTGRFSDIEEDEAPLYVLGNEYSTVK